MFWTTINVAIFLRSLDHRQMERIDALPERVGPYPAQAESNAARHLRESKYSSAISRAARLCRA